MAHLQRLRALVRLGRPRFLAGGVLLYGLGALLAGGRAMHVGAYLLGQSAITATQLMTHYVNDAFDVEADRANATPTRWSGGSRVLARGELSRGTALTTALALGVVALTLDAAILAWGRASWGTPLLLFVALALSWQYSAPPLNLHGHGLGPLTAAIVVGGLTPLAGFGMQGVAWSRAPVLATVPLMFAQFAMILVLDIPDRSGDAALRKRTIVVRIGERPTAWLVVLLVFATHLVAPTLRSSGLPAALANGTLLALPFGALLVTTLLFGEWKRKHDYAALAWRGVLWFVVVGIGELLGALYEAFE